MVPTWNHHHQKTIGITYHMYGIQNVLELVGQIISRGPLEKPRKFPGTWYNLPRNFSGTWQSPKKFLGYMTITQEIARSPQEKPRIFSGNLPRNFSGTLISQEISRVHWSPKKFLGYMTITQEISRVHDNLPRTLPGPKKMPKKFLGCMTTAWSYMNPHFMIYLPIILVYHRIPARPCTAEESGWSSNANLMQVLRALRK